MSSRGRLQNSRVLFRKQKCRFGQVWDPQRDNEGKKG
jgi:hypothetical protein